MVWFSLKENGSIEACFADFQLHSFVQKSTDVILPLKPMVLVEAANTALVTVNALVTLPTDEPPSKNFQAAPSSNCSLPQARFKIEDFASTY